MRRRRGSCACDILALIRMQAAYRQRGVFTAAFSVFLFALFLLPQVALAQTPTAPATAATACDLSTTSRQREAEALARTHSISVEQLTCRRVNPDVPPGSCMTGACAGAADIQCCIPTVGSPPAAAAPTTPAATTPGTATTPTRSSVAGAIQWPSCIDNGDCSLDDIIKAGAAFANFIFGLSGAVFLAIFVYAGVLYLVAGGNEKRVSQAKDMLKNATIGIVLVFGAYAMVSTVYTAFVSTGGGGSGGAAQCTVRYPDHICSSVSLEGDSASTRRARATECGCKLDAGLCPGEGANYICCPIDPTCPSIMGGGEEASTTPTPTPTP